MLGESDDSGSGGSRKGRPSQADVTCGENPNLWRCSCPLGRGVAVAAATIKTLPSHHYQHQHDFFDTSNLPQAAIRSDSSTMLLDEDPATVRDAAPS